jgi:hypothetical protein
MQVVGVGAPGVCGSAAPPVQLAVVWQPPQSCPDEIATWPVAGKAAKGAPVAWQDAQAAVISVCAKLEAETVVCDAEGCWIALQLV